MRRSSKCPKSIPLAERQALQAEARRLIDGTAVPAYSQLLTFMRQDYMPGARTDISAASLPDGPAFYKSQIKEYTTLDLTAEQIHAARAEGSGAHRCRHAGDDEGGRLQGDVPRVPRLPAQRSALLRQDPGRAARLFVLCGEAHGRQAEGRVRHAAALSLHHQAGARRHCADLHLGPRRAVGLPDEHL